MQTYQALVTLDMDHPNKIGLMRFERVCRFPSHFLAVAGQNINIGNCDPKDPDSFYQAKITLVTGSPEYIPEEDAMLEIFAEMDIERDISVESLIERMKSLGWKIEEEG